jgi:uncharacterized repeat protein (TIGR01451 family)
MSARKIALLALALLAALAALSPAGAGAAQKAAWTLALESHPTNFVPGGEARYRLLATNVGSAPAAVRITDTLPAGLTPLPLGAAAASHFACSIDEPTRTVSCESKSQIQPGFNTSLEIPLAVASLPDPTQLKDEAEASGGGASVRTAVTTTISATGAPFSILGLRAPSVDSEGNAATAAGAHPYEQIIDFNVPTVEPGDKLLVTPGHVRDLSVDLPRGLVANPAASPVLCTEAELITEAQPGCPLGAAVGTITVTTSIEAILSESAPLYSMVTPPGSPAVFGFDLLGIFGHVSGNVRSDGDYGLTGTVRDTLALSLNPVIGASVELWGDPTAPAHDRVRGKCLFKEGIESCPQAPRKTAFVTMPTECPGVPLRFGAHTDSWEQPGVFVGAEYESADLQGNPVSLQGCGELPFEPTITARPTTNLADSPAGLDFGLHQPQNIGLKDEEGNESRSNAALKDVTIAFPAGLSVNASQAGGLGACTLEQVGFAPKEGQIHFSKAPQSCPSAAKLGTIEVASPLLVQRNEKHEVAFDPETEEPKLEPLEGSIYLAQPFDNPFGSLVAVYLAIEDEKTGIVAKLAGAGKLDPTTGQITTRFTENPELPIEDFRAHLFGGSRGAFVTPPACGKYTTTANLTPWSAPEGKDKEAKDSFRVKLAAGGANCPSTESQLPHAPSLVAGTLTPQAGKYSPMSFKLSRSDGSQRLGKIEATLPPGLSAKLAGVATCSEAGIANARSREAPNQGAVEQADPSCPATSGIGTLIAAAGAGPTPYYTTGHAYLAGPYKGAPLSVVAIAPAVAGPFDLGTVVVRSVVYLDPETAQAHIVSDPLPQLLDGIPIDLRSVSLQVDRPQFTLNPTSCNEKAFGGSVTSTLGAIAPLSERFQVGGCKSLPYKPKLSARLFGPIHRGGHPKFRTVFTAKAGEANTKSIVLALPHSEFIDQSHFRTICTRVQFAAKQCPAGSIYGHVKATSPLLGYPLEGPVYLRSSNHQLPDAVVALRGPPSQPIEVDVVGRVDSVNGGLRTTIQTVPDAPLTKAIVTLQGGKKGLFQNSTNICKGSFRANLKLEGQNGKVHDTRPLMRADCPKAHKKKNRSRHD